MLYQKILLLEQKIIQDRIMIHQRMEVLNRIKYFLSGLDMTSEVPVGIERDKFIELLEDLKGESLTLAEREMLLELDEVTFRKDDAGRGQ